MKAPKLKGVPFQTAIIERYRRRESSVEEALIEMYLAGAPVRRAKDTTEALMLVCASLRHVVGTQWGTRRYINMDHLTKFEDDLLSDYIVS